VGGHVGKNQVGCPAERFQDGIRRGVAHEIHFQDRHALDRLRGQQVDPRNRCAGPLLAHNLAPAARCYTEIDHAAGVFQQGEFLIEFDEFESRPAAPALCLRAFDIGIVQLPLEPAGRALLAPADLVEAALRVAAAAAHVPVPECSDAWAWAPSRSVLIRLRNMPSRMPRSATPSRGAGQMSRIDSSIAQPATTRSARSRPMQGRARRSSGVMPESRLDISRMAVEGTISPSICRRSYCGSSRWTEASVVTVPLVPSR